MTRPAALVASALLLCSLAGAARAQDRSGFALAVGGGTEVSGDFAPTGALRFQIPIGPLAISVGASATAWNAGTGDNRPNASAEPTVGIDLRFRFGAFEPFVGIFGGPSLTIPAGDSPPPESVHADPAWGWHAGVRVGARYMLSAHFGLELALGCKHREASYSVDRRLRHYDSVDDIYVYWHNTHREEAPMNPITASLSAFYAF